jgi:DNA-binding IclR family transcriptional regulator
MEIIHNARPYLQDLSDRSGETAHLVVWADDINIQFIDKVAGRSTIRMASIAGMQMKAHITATGKVLLSHKSPEFIRRYMENASFVMETPHTITSPTVLTQILEDIRRDGYGCDLDESEDGLTCFAAPIYDMQNNVAAAISVSGPSERMRRCRHTLIDDVKKTAQMISNTLK